MRNLFLPAIVVLCLGFWDLGYSQQNHPQWPKASSQASVATQDDNSTGSISFPNSPVGDVLAYYEMLTGKRVIRDNNINNTLVTIFATKPMTKARAAQFIESALLLNGVALVPADNDTLKALNTSNRKPVSEVVPLYSGTQGIPEGDGVVSYFMPLKFISPEDAKKTFESHVTLHDYGTITIAPGGSALLITENGRLVRRLIELQELLDKEPNKVTSEFVQLQRADAARVAELVSDALTPPEKKDHPGSASPASAPRPPGQPGGPEAGAITISSSGGLFGGDLKLVPDERTNRILVIAAPSSIPLVRAMIQQFDVAAELAKPISRTLRYISVVETLPILTDVLSGPGEKQASGASDANIPRAIPVNPGSLGGGGGTSSPGGTGSGEVADQLSDSQESEGLMSAHIGKIWMVGDPKSNLIMISGPPESIAKANLILDRLDQKPKQVYLATVIGELTVGHDLDFGVNYLQSYNKDYKFGSGFVGNPLGGAAVLKNGLLDPSTILGAASGLTFYGVIGDAVSYYIHALESTNRFKILSRPVVFTSNNKRAKIASGQKIPVPTSTISQLNNAGGSVLGNAANSVFGSNVALQSNITFEDVLLKLEVIPLINANGEVTLKIAQTNNSVVGSQEVSGNSIPIIGTQELNTTITVKNRQTIVLGGLVSESIKKDYQGIPILSQIPYLGYAFRTTTKERERKELMIFIQPIVIDDNEQALQVTSEEKARTEIPSDVGDQLRFEKDTPGLKVLRSGH